MIIFICVSGIYSVKPKKATRICTIFIFYEVKSYELLSIYLRICE
ncbi:hypothetical protein EJK49_1902 [Moraxella catarrhalis]|nr:hypothetical protein EJK49_1902 [Moraxella catarrhalis]